MWQRMLQGGETASHEIVELILPYMTSNTSSSGTAKGDRGTGNSAPAYMAFDNNESTRWASNTGAGSWLEYQFKEPKTVTKFYIKAGYSSNSSGVKNFKIQGSNDETNWVDLTDEITLPNTSGGAGYSGELKIQNYYNYYRFYATTNSYFSGGKWIAVSILKLYGF